MEDTSPRKRKRHRTKTKSEKLEGLKKFLLKHEGKFRLETGVERVTKRGISSRSSRPATSSSPAPSSSRSVLPGLSVAGPVLAQQPAARHLTTSGGRVEAEYESEVAWLGRVRTWEQLPGPGPGPGQFQFSLLCYNILAPSLLASHRYLYRDCATRALDWAGWRWAGLRRELARLGWPDLLCLQELQLDTVADEVVAWLQSRGYTVVTKRRTGDKKDGCAIAFNKSRFLLDEASDIEYRIERLSLLDRDNVGQVLRLLPRTESEPGPPLLVATTHLLYNPRRPDIRLCQAALLLAELDRAAYQPGGPACPVILCGDLNSSRGSPALQLLEGGSCRYPGLPYGRAGSRKMPAKLLPDTLGLSDSCQWEVALQQRGLADNFTTGSGEFRHRLDLQPVYSRGVTSHQEDWAMVDHILYTRHPRLGLTGRLRLPSHQEMQMFGRIPSLACPSDHLPLLAQFSLRV